jgi:ubiquinone/menaquinone biosynthesis C-methylase UbiE
MYARTHPRGEPASTYFVPDRSHKEELLRLQIQDQILTAGMGGALPEQPDPTIFQRVLDVGCGTGGWLIEAARTYPNIPVLVGVDVSERFIKYAQAQAQAQGVGDRVEFRVMDALRRLEFPTRYFDLVNHRLGIGYLRTWDWPQLLLEYQRVARSGGIIRITECNFPESNSAALTRLNDLFLRALSQAGHMFIPNDSYGLINELVPLCERVGLGNVQTDLHTLEYRVGTAEGQSFIEDEKHLFRVLLPFLNKWSHLPDDYEEIYQRAVNEMRHPDFVATWKLLTVWGINP